MFPQDDGLKAVMGDWHNFRENARRTAHTINEFGEGDIIRYDLETAGITGRANVETYTTDNNIDVTGERGTDVRTLDNR